LAGWSCTSFGCVCRWMIFLIVLHVASTTSFGIGWSLGWFLGRARAYQVTLLSKGHHAASAASSTVLQGPHGQRRPPWQGMPHPMQTDFGSVHGVGHCVVRIGSLHGGGQQTPSFSGEPLWSCCVEACVGFVHCTVLVMFAFFGGVDHGCCTISPQS
jgi:hypothetical protein